MSQENGDSFRVVAPWFLLSTFFLTEWCCAVLHEQIHVSLSVASHVVRGQYPWELRPMAIEQIHISQINANGNSHVEQVVVDVGWLCSPDDPAEQRTECHMSN